jgi:hypothetical protein
VIAADFAGADEHVGDSTADEHLATIKTIRTNHQRQISEITVTPGTPTPLAARTVLNEDAREPSDPSTPTLVSDSDEDRDLPFIDAITPPDMIRLRRIPQQSSTEARSQQALQPLRSPNYFTTQAPSRKRAISVALVQKAYSLLIAPPSHLVSLMLDIAARIVRSMQGARDRRRRVPGAWNSSSAEEEDEWDEDDFGIRLDNLGRDSTRVEPGLSIRSSRAASRASSVASSDYDALVEGPLLRRIASRRSSGSLD